MTTSINYDRVTATSILLLYIAKYKALLGNNSHYQHAPFINTIKLFLMTLWSAKLPHDIRKVITFCE